MLEQSCPCGRLNKSTKPFAFTACCGRYLNNFEATPAPDAESLMRSRYSAYAIQRVDYLLATWHTRTRPVDIPLDDATKWLGLEVRRCSSINSENAQVEFIARYRTAGLGARIHEVSRFVREAGRWTYLDGDFINRDLK